MAANNDPKKGTSFVFMVDTKGEGVITDFLAITHETNCTLDRSTTVAEVTTKEDDGAVFRDANAISWSMTSDGVMSLFNNSFERLELLWGQRAKVWVAFVDKAGAEYKYGQGIIESLNETASADGIATFSVSVSGSGSLTTTKP